MPSTSSGGSEPASLSGVCPPSDTMTPTTFPPGGQLGVEHVGHVLVGQRLEVQAVRGVVVGRDRLGVAVDHDRLVAGVAQRHGRVHAAVVELDPLPDPVGPRAEDDDPGAFGRADLVLLLVGRVVVRRERLELGGAGVDRLERRPDAVGQSGGAHVRRASRRAGRRAARRRSPVAWPGGSPPASSEARRRRGACRSAVMRASWRTNHGSMPVRGHHLVDPDAPAQGRLELEDPVGGRHGDRARAGPSSLSASSADLGRVGVEAGPALLQRAQRLLQRLAERAADRHHLADRLHAGARGAPSAPGSFSKAQRGTLVTT